MISKNIVFNKDEIISSLKNEGEYYFSNVKKKISPL